jgi:hypothetical protein
MKKSRLLYIGIPLAVLLAALTFYQYGYLRIREELNLIREEQESKAKTLEKYLAVIAEQPFLEQKRMVFEEQRKAESANLMSGETYSLAAAALQETVKGIIVSRNGVISSERMGKEEDYQPSSPTIQGEGPGGPKKALPETKAPPKEAKKRFKIVQVSFDFTAPDIGVLRDIVYFIETKTPYLVIRELDVRVRNFRDPRDLMVRLDVAALYGGR